MIKTIDLLPGITLRCCPADRFKQGCFSLQIVRPMRREEAALNALLPAVLLRGTQKHPDLRAITLHLDDLYGAAVGTQVRRVGDYQTTGLYCAMMEDKYALDGDKVLEPMLAFLAELLFEPALEEGVFCTPFVEGEKRNLISVIEAKRNDKRAYAAAQLIKYMCQGDSFGISQLGEKEDVAAVTPAELYAHFQKILRESRIDLFYVGSFAPQSVAEMLRVLFERIDRNYVNLPEQTPFCAGADVRQEEMLDVTQGKLGMGFVTPITLRDPAFVPMQVLNTVLGGGMISKLFMQIREKMSLCYDISSIYHGSKGLLTVSAGIDFDRETQVREEVLRQLDACRKGEITPQELTAAKQALISSLRTIHDTPAGLENFYTTAALSGLPYTAQTYMQAVEQVTVEQVVQAAKTLRLHTVYFLKGVQ